MDLTGYWLVFWLVFAIAVGYVAANRGRSGLGWFLLAVLISPLITLIILLAIGQPGDNSTQPNRYEQSPSWQRPAEPISKSLDREDLGTWRVVRSHAREIYDREPLTLRVNGNSLGVHRPAANGTKWIVSVPLEQITGVVGGNLSFTLPDGLVQLKAVGDTEAQVSRLREGLERAAALRPSPSGTLASNRSQSESAADRLQRLSELHSSGLITDDEFALKRREIVEAL